MKEPAPHTAIEDLPAIGAVPPLSGVRLERSAMRILLVQGDAGTARTLAASLPRHGYEFDQVARCQDAMLVRHTADLLILDLDSPHHDGLELCRRIRAADDIPIIALSCDRTEAARVRGLWAGADDCIDKPFGLRELVARIEVVLDRSHTRPQLQKTLSSGRLSLDRGVRKARLGDQFIDLTGKEFELLWLLVSRPGAVVSREEIMARVWDDTWNRRGRVIDTYVSSIRNKLGQGAWITTIRGVGFRFAR